MKKAFTLVELLIVITLISILSVAVLATINPIEQTNKARDAQFKNDAAEVLSAYERFYASQNAYPWNIGPLSTDTLAAGVQLVIGGSSPAFGVLGHSVGDTNAELIITSELKSSFQGKAPFSLTAAAVDQIWTYHNGSDANYVCYIPKAKVNRTGANVAKLKCLNVAAPALLNNGDVGCTSMTDVDWATAITGPLAGRANVACVPE